LSLFLGLSSLDDLGDLVLKFPIFQNPAFFLLTVLRTGFLRLMGYCHCVCLLMEKIEDTSICTVTRVPNSLENSHSLVKFFTESSWKPCQLLFVL